MTIDIHTSDLLILYSLLIIPLTGFYVLRIKLIGKLTLAVIRMSLQLSLIGLYLKYVFILNNPLVNLLWILVMIFIANVNVTGNIGLKRKRIFFLTLAGITAGTFLTVSMFIFVVIQPHPLLDARYLIPISGMILGNCLRGNILVLERFFSEIKNDEKGYMNRLFLGATYFEAVRPYMRNAVSASMSPLISTMATMGIVSLPGMMTGQILGGSPPAMAVKYQIAIMIAIFTAAAVSGFINLWLCTKAGFDEFGRLDRSMYR